MEIHNIYEKRDEDKNPLSYNEDEIIKDLFHRILNNLKLEIYENKRNRNMIERIIKNIRDPDTRRFLIYLKNFLFNSSFFYRKDFVISFLILSIGEFISSESGFTYFYSFIYHINEDLKEEKNKEEEEKLQFNQYLEEIIKNEQNEPEIIESDSGIIIYDSNDIYISKSLKRVKNIISEILEDIYNK